MKMLLGVGSLLTMTCVTACQSTISPAQPMHDGVANLPNAQHAKQLVLNAKHQQRKREYIYQTDVMVDLEKRMAAFDQASELQLSMASEPEKHCDHVHDAAYLALLKHAEEAGNDLTDVQYAVPAEAIKHAFLACNAELTAWEASYYGNDSTIYDEDNRTFDEVDERIESVESDWSVEGDWSEAETKTVLTNDAQDDAQNNNHADAKDLTRYGMSDPVIVSPDLNSRLEEETDNNQDAVMTQPIRDEFLPGYDNRYTHEKLIKQKLMNRYLLEPLDHSIYGIYRPHVGVMSAMPILQYQTPNHTTAASLPLYFDAKSGTISVWADSFVYPISEILDPELGLAWRNKWLTLNLDDGTLPRGFGKSVVRSFFHASDVANEQIEPSRYRAIRWQDLQHDSKYQKIVQNNQFSNDKPISHASNLSNHKTTPSNNSLTLVELTWTSAQVDAYAQTYIQTLYDDLLLAYPSLDPKTLSDPDAASDVQNLASLGLAHNAIDENSDTVTDHSIGRGLTSEVLVKQALKLLRSRLSEDETSADKNFNSDLKSPHPISNAIVYATMDEGRGIEGLDIKLPTENEIMVREVYALDKQGAFVWKYTSINDLLGDGIDVVYLTNYSDISSNSMMFPNLPAHLQVPTEATSVDVTHYLSDLRQRIENGEGTELGKMVFDTADVMLMLLMESNQ